MTHTEPGFDWNPLYEFAAQQSPLDYAAIVTFHDDIRLDFWNLIEFAHPALRHVHQSKEEAESTKRARLRREEAIAEEEEYADF